MAGPIGSITSANLKKLNLSSNKLSGSLPAQVGHCAIIDLSNNMLSGSLSRVQSWGNYVEVIRLSSNSLSGSLPNQTSQFLRLTSLEISENSLVGALPPVLGTYPELKVIDLSFNQLNGILLPSLFTSTKLANLNLSGNNFSGAVPFQETRNITSIDTVEVLSLMSLDLSNNSLSGYLPLGISRFRNLVYLDLSHNNLEGSIPDDLPGTLQGFNVSFNNFSGVVPQHLKRFPDSAFHPGNNLLIFPYSQSSPRDVTNRTPSNARSHMKRVIRIALIAGLVGGTAVICLLCILIYSRTRWQEHTRSSSKKDDAKIGISERSSSISYRSGPNKSVDPSLSAITFDQDIFTSSQLGSGNYAGETSSVAKKHKDVGQLVSGKIKREGVSPPMSHLSSSSPSPSKKQLPDNPGVINVCSPEKLAGNLHLFDGSFLFTAEELSRALAEVIGKSCHGTLYKATLDSGDVLAVKWLREGIVKGRNEFAREVKKLGNIKHPNLVSLQGYYWGPKEHEKMIISNYFNAQSLAPYLHGKILFTLLDTMFTS